MRRLQRYRQPESQMNVTPMLDVVFILLIFFIVTASFVKETSIDVERSGSGAAKEPVGAKGNILVQLTANDEIWMNRRPVAPTAIQTNLKQMHAENPKAKVIVSPHPESSAGLLVRVIDSSRLAGVQDVSLARAH